MLHHLPLHVCGWNKLWAVSLPSLCLRATGGHQSWLWLVHVLCLGRPGTNASGWIPMHVSPLPQYSSDCCTETQTGKRCRVITTERAQETLAQHSPAPAVGCCQHSVGIRELWRRLITSVELSKGFKLLWQKTCRNITLEFFSLPVFQPTILARDIISCSWLA